MIYCAMPYAIEDLIPIEKTFKKDELVTDAKADLIRGYVEDIDFVMKNVKLGDGTQLKYENLL